jgi:ABC-type bacteriocin/lantibiotic exporter with double-glycine peptidase domain
MSMRLRLPHNTPIRLQVDPIECGAICLGIVAEYWGRYESSPTLKKMAEVSKFGANAKSLIMAAEALGISAVASSLMASQIKKESGPAILFFDHGHFVVYEGHFNGKFYINDPATGKYRLTFAQFKSRYSNVFLQLSRNSRFTKSKPVINPGRRCEALRRCLEWFLGLGAGALLAYILIGTGFLLEAAIFDGSKNLTLTTIIFLAAATIVLAMIKRRQAAQKFASNCAFNQQEEWLEKLPYVGSQFFWERPASHYLVFFERFFAEHSLGVQKGLDRYFLWGYLSSLLASLALISVEIMLWVMLFWAMFLTVMLIHRYWVHRQVSDTEHGLWSLGDNIDHLWPVAEDLKCMGQENALVSQFMSHSLGGVAARAKISVASSITFSVIFSVAFLGVAAIAVGNIRHEAMSIGELVAILLVFFFGLTAVPKLAKSHCSMPASLRFQRWFREILDYEQTPMVFKDEPTSVLMRFSKVSLDFTATMTKPLIQNISLTIHPSQVVALVTASQYESSLLQLMATKVAPTSGEITVSKQYEPALNRFLLDQNSFIFAGTLFDNVSLFGQMLGSAQVVRALGDACALDLTHNHPEGLLRKINENGTNLSYGERLRLLLARGLAHKCDLLLLDHFFQGIDEETSKQILHNLRALGIAVVFSPFREVECVLADRVIFIDHHHNIFEGSHTEMLASLEAYRRHFATIKSLEV